MAKSHTAAIDQLLEEFNDDQMMFHLEAEAYEQERLAAMENRVPTPTDHNDEPPIANTTEARQEGPAPAEIAPELTTMTTTEPDSEEMANEPLDDANP